MVTKITQLFIIIGLLVSVNSFGQKSNTPKSGEYEIEADYAPGKEEKVVKTEDAAAATSIKLSVFKGAYIEESSFIQLEWAINVKLGTFIVEHSIDGETYSEIGEVVDPAGFEKSLYAFEAREFEAGINFYRLKQVVNNKVIYSESKAVSVSKKDDVHILKIKDEGDTKKIQLRVRETQNVVIQLYDKEGNLKKELFNQKMDDNEIIFRTIIKNEFEAGTYFILIKGDNFKQSKKVELP